MTLPREILKHIKDIRDDNTSSSLAITRKAASVIRRYLSLARQGTPSALRRGLKEISTNVVRAQPLMASVFNLTETVAGLVDSSEDRILRSAVDSGVRDFVKRLDESSDLIARTASRFIRSGTTVLTHSYSSLVYQTFLHSHNQGKRFNVICTESRPMREGVTLARRLSKSGISTTVITEAAIFSFLPEVSFIFVGADSISQQGVVNKVGTHMIALAAKLKGIRFHVLCCTQKFVRTSPVDLTSRLRNPREILLQPSSRHLMAKNVYFDLTPLSLPSGIISEMGLIVPGNFKSFLKHLHHNTLS